MSQVEVEELDVVGVFVQVLLVIASLLAGPAAAVVEVFEPDVSPVAEAVTVQAPGTPLTVSVGEVPLAAVPVVPTLMAPVVLAAPAKLQIVVSLTVNVTVVAVVAVVVLPPESLSVAFTGVVLIAPAGYA